MVDVQLMIMHIVTYVTLGWTSPNANLLKVNVVWKFIVMAIIYYPLTRCRILCPSSFCLLLESPPRHGPTSPSSDRLRWCLSSSNTWPLFSQFSAQTLIFTSIEIFFFPHLPVGERPLPLAGSGLVFGLDDHDTPLRGAQLAPVDSCKQEQILTGCSFTFIE